MIILILISRELECRAVGLIDQASKKNLQKSLELIEAAHPLWGGRTIIDLAALSHDQNFLACHTCQTYIQSAWKKGFQASGKRVISFTLFPPLWLFSSIIFLPRKTRTKTKNVESATKMQEISNDCTEKDQLTSNPQEPIQRQNSKAKIPIWDQNEDLWYRIKTFYTSPVVKFTSHTVSISPTERSLNTSDPNS